MDKLLIPLSSKESYRPSGVIDERIFEFSGGSSFVGRTHVGMPNQHIVIEHGEVVYPPHRSASFSNSMIASAIEDYYKIHEKYPIHSLK